MGTQGTGRYVTVSVPGESFKAFVPNPLPPKLPARELATLDEPLRKANAALSRLDLAGEMIPSLDWFIDAFVRKEALLSSEIEGTQATLVDVIAWEHTDQTVIRLTHMTRIDQEVGGCLHERPAACKV